MIVLVEHTLLSLLLHFSLLSDTRSKNFLITEPKLQKVLIRRNRSFIDLPNMNHSSKEETTTSIAIIAIVAALALLGVIVVVTIVTIPQQQAEAGCVTGYFHSGNKSALFTAFEKSEGRC